MNLFALFGPFALLRACTLGFIGALIGAVGTVVAAKQASKVQSAATPAAGPHIEPLPPARNPGGYDRLDPFGANDAADAEVNRLLGEGRGNVDQVIEQVAAGWNLTPKGVTSTARPAANGVESLTANPYVVAGGAALAALLVAVLIFKKR